jgi:hypothetical protein
MVLRFLAGEVAADKVTASAVAVVGVVVAEPMAEAMAKLVVAVETADGAHQALRELTTTTT